MDEGVAVGERLSAMLVSEHLLAEGMPAEAVNAWDIMVTDAVFGNASPLMEPTRVKASARLLPLLERGIMPIVTGFNGATADGRPTTLGRGGSDFSASILAAALDAAELWIWTDVDGIMSADPRLVHDAEVMDEITYAEAAELAYNGAKVLHPRTLAPLVEKKIPVWSKNSFAPEKPGTQDRARQLSRGGVRAVASMTHVALISHRARQSRSQRRAWRWRAPSTRSPAPTSKCSCSRARVTARASASWCASEELDSAVQALESALALELAHGYLRPIEVDDNVGLLAAVGEGMQGKPGLPGRIFTAISRVHVNIIAIAQGSSELTIADSGTPRRPGKSRARSPRRVRPGQKTSRRTLSRNRVGGTPRQ